MKLILLSVAMFLAASAALAQQPAPSPTPADFYAARDRARQALGWTSNGCPGRPDLKQAEFAALLARLEGELDALLRQMIGGVTTPKGFAGQGEWSPGLGCGLGMDALDGIAFHKGLGEDHAVVLVTSDPILRRWLAPAPERADPDAAFSRGRLNASVIDQASWQAVFAAMPVARPAGIDVATAFLGTGGNGDLFWPPRLIWAYVRKGDRVLIADAGLATKFAALEACDAPRRAAEERARPATHADRIRLSQETADAFNECWEQRGKDQPAFASALRQAQALVDDLAMP